MRLFVLLLLFAEVLFVVDGAAAGQAVKTCATTGCPLEDESQLMSKGVSPYHLVSILNTASSNNIQFYLFPKHDCQVVRLCPANENGQVDCTTPLTFRILEETVQLGSGARDEWAFHKVVLDITGSKMTLHRSEWYGKADLVFNSGNYTAFLASSPTCRLSVRVDQKYVPNLKVSNLDNVYGGYVADDRTKFGQPKVGHFEKDLELSISKLPAATSCCVEENKELGGKLKGLRGVTKLKYETSKFGSELKKYNSFLVNIDTPGVCRFIQLSFGGATFSLPSTLTIDMDNMIVYLPDSEIGKVLGITAPYMSHFRVMLPVDGDATFRGQFGYAMNNGKENSHMLSEAFHLNAAYNYATGIHVRTNGACRLRLENDWGDFDEIKLSNSMSIQTCSCLP